MNKFNYANFQACSTLCNIIHILMSAQPMCTTLHTGVYALSALNIRTVYSANSQVETEFPIQCHISVHFYTGS